jgi:site-specific DNA-methyltransferase (adenine-specific)
MTLDLRNVDCYKEIKNISSDSIQLIYFNPPFGITGNEWDVSLDYSKLWKDFWRVLKPRGCVIIHSSGKFTMEVINSQLRHFKHRWFWDKHFKTGHLSAKFQPMRKIEELCVFYKKSPTYNPQMVPNKKPYTRKYDKPTHNNTGYYGKRKTHFTHEKTYDKQYPTHIIKFNRRKHRYSTRPDELCDYIIKTYTNENDTVLDITMSDSQTGKSCLKLKRNYIGFEINQERYNDAIKNTSISI